MSEDEIRIAGALRGKLSAAKERWAEEGPLITGVAGDPTRDRLPPGQTLARGFPVLDLGIQPHVPLTALRLDLDGLVVKPLSLDRATLMALLQAERVNDIHCVTRWSTYDNRWSGIPVPALLALAQPLPEARFALFEAHDGYTTSLALADFDREANPLAHGWGGAPLEHEHGGPLRIVVPHLYFRKSAKWVCRITLTAEDRPGFWEARGYHHRGDPWAEERYA